MMEAVGKIYRPFGINRPENDTIEAYLKADNFNLWTTTKYPDRTMVSFGGRDSLDNEKTLQGYIERGKRIGTNFPDLIVCAFGNILIDYMDSLTLN